MGERLGIDFQKVRRKRVRCWEYHPSFAHPPEFAQTLPESGTGRIETIEHLCQLERSGEGRRGDTPLPDSQQTILNRRFEGPTHTARNPPHKIRNRVGREGRVKICRGEGVAARPGSWVKTWENP